jgi:hypothetical protein
MYDPAARTDCQRVDNLGGEKNVEGMRGNVGRCPQCLGVELCVCFPLSVSFVKNY